MSEALPPPPQLDASNGAEQQAQVEAESNFTAVEINLGEGNKNDLTLSLDNESLPPAEGSETFKIGELDASLIAVIKPAGEEAKNIFGLVKTRLEGNISGVDDVLLVQMAGEKNIGYTVLEQEGRPLAAKVGENEVISIGRGSQNNSEVIGQNLSFEQDIAMSASHFTVKRNNNELIIIDNDSTNGTTVEFMGIADNFTLEDLSADMKKLRGEMLKGLGGVAVTGEAELVNNRESSEDVKDRNDELFFAYDPEGKAFKDLSEFDFDSMFSPDDIKGEVPKQTPEQITKANLDKRFAVNEESLSAARSALGIARQDSEIKLAIDRFKVTNPEVFRDYDIMKALREDAVLRKEVGVRLLELTNSNVYGSGIATDKKTPTYAGYELYKNLKPQEYVALLALAMIDGSFKPSDSKIFAPNVNRLGEDENGKSRNAAKRVLSDIERTAREASIAN